MRHSQYIDVNISKRIFARKVKFSYIVCNSLCESDWRQLYWRPYHWGPRLYSNSNFSLFEYANTLGPWARHSRNHSFQNLFPLERVRNKMAEYGATCLRWEENVWKNHLKDLGPDCIEIESGWTSLIPCMILIKKGFYWLEMSCGHAYESHTLAHPIQSWSNFTEPFLHGQ